MTEQVESHILRKYSLVKKIGSGAYGHVWKITDRKSGKIMALKKIFDAFQHSTDAQRTFRQIVFLHELQHPNIIKLHNVIRAENDKDLYLVFEFMEADLHNAIGQKILKDIHNRFVMYQIVKGINYLHSAQLIHRDLKPSNVLLNSDCTLKICDFGLARSLADDKEGNDMILTQQVATRWYRAPQILLGSQKYEKSADIWSIGCILGQILLGKPFFPGNSTLNQLQKIISWTGMPSKTDINSLNCQLASSMISSVNINTKSTKDWFKSDTPEDAIHLLTKMLQFNPTNRPTTQQILQHPYLIKFFSQKDITISGKTISPPISDNTKLNLKQYRQLIYQRIRKIYRNPEQQQQTKKIYSSLRSIGRNHTLEYRHSTKDESPAADKPKNNIYTPSKPSRLLSTNQSCSSLYYYDPQDKKKKQKSKQQRNKVPSNCFPTKFVQKFYRRSTLHSNNGLTKENKLYRA